MHIMKYKLRRMIEVIEKEAKYTSSFTGKDKLDPAVMDAMGKIPRDEFVPDDLKSAAFDDCPLPIGHGQTISQPYMVALMTDLLRLEPENAVLEVGTGSGYQTAVLSLLCKKVCTIELVAALGEAASKRLKKLGYENIESRITLSCALLSLTPPPQIPVPTQSRMTFLFESSIMNFGSAKTVIEIRLNKSTKIRQSFLSILCNIY